MEVNTNDRYASYDNSVKPYDLNVIYKYLLRARNVCVMNKYHNLLLKRIDDALKVCRLMVDNDTPNDSIDGIIKESIRKVLKEEAEGQLYKMSGKELWDEIDRYLLQQTSIGSAHVSRFYSDDDHIVISLHRNHNGAYEKKRIVNVMHNLGYEYYDAGANGDYIMMTFTPFRG